MSYSFKRMHCGLFPIQHFVCAFIQNLKHYGIYECSIHQMTVLLSNTFLSGLTLHVSSDWQAIATSTYHGLFHDKTLYEYLKHTSKPDSTFNFTTLQIHVTPLLPRMFLLCWKQQSSYNLQAMTMYIDVHCCLIVLCAKTQGACDCTIHQTNEWC